MSQRNSRGGGVTRALLVILILLLIAGSAMMIYLCIQIAGKPAEKHESGEIATFPDAPTQITTVPTETEPPETTMPEPEHVVSTATITVTGDLLPHTTIYMSKYSAECYQSDGTYNFDSVFKYAADQINQADYAVANLETTLRGTDKPYSGFPCFNTPDALATSAKTAGFDMLLTANNHCNDTGVPGIKRTLEVVRDNDLDTLGTQLTAEEPRYLVKNINDINIGMMCYTYETNTSPDIVALNGITLASDGKGMVNAFDPANPAPFYEEVAQSMEKMKDEGAEAVVIYLHWGIEYNLFANDQQKKMAQKLCDLGVDVIVGGHPHVIEPVELLTSAEDPDHKTVCLYSLGNAVSNQRLGNLSMINTAHTEDGMFFNITFEKYSDGTVYLADVDIVPVWVNMYTNDNGRREYNMLPLDMDKQDQWMELFSIGENTYNKAVKSYERTMDIVGEGLTASQEYLAAQKVQRDADYLDAVLNPRPATEPTEIIEFTEPLETTEAAA